MGKGSPKKEKDLDCETIWQILYSNMPVKLLCPHPPEHRRDITFWGAAPVFLSLNFFLARPI